MQSVITEKIQVIEATSEIKGVLVGNIVKAEESGEIWIDYPGNDLGPLPARLTSSVKKESLPQAADSKQEVLLVFENNDPNKPIIIDTLYSPVEEILNASSVAVETDVSEDVIMDGKRVVFDAKEEIILRCGKGSITLRKDGKVIIKGANLISRSSGINKIKGAAVRIN